MPINYITIKIQQIFYILALYTFQLSSLSIKDNSIQKSGSVGINSCGRSKHSDCSLFWPQLSQGGKINDT
jgi:hypothetical protein